MTLEAIERLEELAKRAVFHAVVPAADLRSLLSAHKAQAERLRVVESALVTAREAMTWAEAHVGGHAKYENAQQVVNCLANHEDALAVVEAALSQRPAEEKTDDRD